MRLQAGYFHSEQLARAESPLVGRVPEQEKLHHNSHREVNQSVLNIQHPHGPKLSKVDNRQGSIHSLPRRHNGREHHPATTRADSWKDTFGQQATQSALRL